MAYGRVFFSPDGKQLATGSVDNSNKSYSLATRWRATPTSSLPSRSLPTANSFAREVTINPSNFEPCRWKLCLDVTLCQCIQTHFRLATSAWGKPYAVINLILRTYLSCQLLFSSPLPSSWVSLCQHPSLQRSSFSSLARTPCHSNLPNTPHS